MGSDEVFVVRMKYNKIKVSSKYSIILLINNKNKLHIKLINILNIMADDDAKLIEEIKASEGVFSSLKGGE